MEHLTRHAATALSCLLLAGAAQAESTLSFDANLELDSDLIQRGDDDLDARQGGRIEFNLRGERRLGDYFARAKGTALIKKDGEVDSDDAYFQFGNSHWDLQVGRFEAVDLFPKGKDTIVEHAGGVTVYEANYVRGRASDRGQIALHYYPTEAVSLELASLFGTSDTLDSDERPITGLRPSIQWRVNEIFTLTAGGEALRYDRRDGQEVRKEGVALSAGLLLDDTWINLNVARLTRDTEGGPATTAGINLLNGPLGLGLIHSDADDDGRLTTAYAAYTVPLFDIPDATVTFGASYSRTEGTADDDDVAVARVRFNYQF